MKNQRRTRPDSIDVAIIRYLQNAPYGATVPEINRAVCPERRENFVRYRISTLHATGLLREARIFNRVVVYPADNGRRLREVTTDA